MLKVSMCMLLNVVSLLEAHEQIKLGLVILLNDSHSIETPLILGVDVPSYRGESANISTSVKHDSLLYRFRFSAFLLDSERDHGMNCGMHICDLND